MTTKRQIVNAVAQLATLTRFPLQAHWAYGRPQIDLMSIDNPGAIARQFSPRLPRGELRRWVETYTQGYDDGMAAITTAARPERTCPVEG